MSHTELSKEERVKLESYLEAGLEQKECASRFGRDAGALSREIRRNRDPVTGLYNAKRAHERTRQRRRKPKKKLETDTDLQSYVIAKIMDHWSPEQIAGRLEHEQGERVIHFDTIYWWIYQKRPELIVFLRRGKKRQWRRKHGTRLREKQRELAKKRWIHERPSIIEKRKRIGDWEGDTMVGRQNEKDRFLTYAERQSGYLITRKLESSTAAETRLATKIAFKKVSKKKKYSCTYDNGVEFSDHEFIERDTKMTVYFAHPYSSWERGTNENTNGLIREFFPKKSSFATVTQKDLDRVARILNTRPRKRNNYQTPTEVFNCN